VERSGDRKYFYSKDNTSKDLKDTWQCPLILLVKVGLRQCGALRSVQWRIQEFCSGGGAGSTNSVEDRGQRERGSGGGSPLVRGSGGSCNLIKEISFHIVKFS